jgi:anti-sigma factor RsiW
VKHFSEQVWADVVRGIASAQAHQELETHLASGCSDCAKTMGLWQNFRSIAANELSFTPPEGVVRQVKLAFARVNSPQPNSWTMAGLVFDNLSHPLTAGVRSGASPSRQLMFDADETTVDLLLDVRPQAHTMSLIGQVVNKRSEQTTPRHVSVILWTETGQPLAETSTNEFGEFQLEFAPQQQLRLSVEIAGCKPIRIPPIDLTSDEIRPSVT